MQEIKNKNQSQLSFEKADLIYNPGALGKALIHYQDKITDLREDIEKTLILRSSELMNWEKSEEIKIPNLLNKPEENSKFGEITGNINDSKDFNELKKNFADFIFYNSNFKLYHSPLIKIYSKPRESKSDFILRITQMARERRDEEVDKIEEKYSKDLQKLKEKLERSQEVLLKKQATANSLKQEAMVSAGESVIKIFMGRRSTTSASKAMNKYQKSKTVAIDIQEAQKDIETLNKEMELLENKLKIEVESIKERREKEISEIKEVLIQPKKSDIEVKIVSLAWIPYWEITYKKEGKLNTEIIPGYL